jgi:UDP-N-acetylglucosamine--dolichyl-phosphate N-acetylglucosaminephosphotransferase
MEPLLVLSLLLGFFLTVISTPIWIKKTKQIGLVWEDMHKKDHPKNVAGSGGVNVFFGFALGVLFYIAVRTFYFKSTENLIETFAMLSSILIISFIGFTDDLFGWRKGGLSKRTRILLLIFAAIPLMVINAGESMMMGIEFGLLYPLIFIPIGIVGAATSFNFLAGYNGLETGQGILLLGALSFVSWKIGNPSLAIIGLIMVSALLAFYIFNKYPAKIFPGDVLTYSVGALIAIMAILGNMEKIAIFFFIPYIIETILKVRGGLKKESFAKLNDDGSLEMPYKKIYGLEHLAIYVLKKIKPSKKVYERNVVYTIHFFQIVFIILGIVLFL